MLTDEYASLFEVNNKVKFQKLKQRLDTVLPDENFYAYCFDEDEDETYDFENPEFKEISRLIFDNLKNGRWCIKNQNSAYY